MAAVDDPKTLGRTRLSFADERDIDEFADLLGQFSGVRSGRTNGAPSAFCVARTGNVRLLMRRCCA